MAEELVGEEALRQRGGQDRDEGAVPPEAPGMDRQAVISFPLPRSPVMSTAPSPKRPACLIRRSRACIASPVPITSCRIPRPARVSRRSNRLTAGRASAASASRQDRRRSGTGLAFCEINPRAPTTWRRPSTRGIQSDTPVPGSSEAPSLRERADRSASETGAGKAGPQAFGMPAPTWARRRGSPPSER